MHSNWRHKLGQVENIYQANVLWCRPYIVQFHDMVIWRLLNSRQCNDTAAENIRGSKAGGWPACGRYSLLVLQS